MAAVTICSDFGAQENKVSHYFLCPNHGIWSHHFMANRWGNSDRLYFGGLQKALQMVTAAMELKDVCSLEEKL